MAIVVPSTDSKNYAKYQEYQGVLAATTATTTSASGLRFPRGLAGGIATMPAISDGTNVVPHAPQMTACAVPSGVAFVLPSALGSALPAALRSSAAPHLGHH